MRLSLRLVVERLAAEDPHGVRRSRVAGSRPPIASPRGRETPPSRKAPCSRPGFRWLFFGVFDDGGSSPILSGSHRMRASPIARTSHAITGAAILLPIRLPFSAAGVHRRAVGLVRVETRRRAETRARGLRLAGSRLGLENQNRAAIASSP